MLSTGSPLAPESFDYVYDAIKADMHLASISGGTDIVSCFVLGDPTAPVWRGEIQAAGPRHGGRRLVDDDGKPLADGKGELVCTRAVPVDAGRCSGTIRTARNTAPPISSASRHLVPRRLRRVDRSTAA